MKVLFLAAANSIHTVKWVNSLAERDHEIHLVYNKGHDPTCDRINKDVILHQLPYSGGMAYYRNVFKLKVLIKKVHPDVINAHYASGYGTLARMANLQNILLSVWGSDVYDFPYRNFVNKRILKKNIKHAKMVASTSVCMADKLRQVLNLPELEVKITPFGVDLKSFTLESIGKQKKDIILLGNIKTLEPLYGVAEFIKSVKIVLDNFKNQGLINIAEKIQVHIYGAGSQEEELKVLIKECVLDKVVFLKGKIPNEEVPMVLNDFDIFCATSFKESFGVAVVEAMAMKVPVVVTDADGFKEVVVNGETGFIVPKGDIDAIAQKLEALILNKELREQFGIAGRQRVERLYDWKCSVDTMEQIYEQIRECKM